MVRLAVGKGVSKALEHISKTIGLISNQMNVVKYKRTDKLDRDGWL